MNQITSFIQLVAPIFCAVALGILARKRKMLTPEGTQGLQDFVINLGLPCVIFNSCLTADIGAESVGTMLLVFPVVLLCSVCTFRYTKKHNSYHNLPMLFTAQETGTLGIPLFILLFGADQAYRMGILDLTQAIIVFPVIAILSSNAMENPSPLDVAKKALSSPLMIMSLTGLFLNLTGIGNLLDSVGIGQIITSCTSFLAQPVSALMIFCVGYNFTLDKENRGEILKISGIHFVLFFLLGLIVQAGLFLIPNVEPETRWAVLMYSTLPACYLAPGLGRNEKEYIIASGICSVLTIVSLVIFCILAAII